MNDTSSEGGDRIVVSCPNCREKYSIAATRIPPQGGRLTCRICAGRILLPGRRPGMAAPIVANTPEAGGAVQPVVASRAVEVESATALRVPIECPHCHQSFVPGIAPPVAAPPSTASKSDAPFSIPAREPGGRKTILVAEDTEFFLELVKETLGAQYRMLGARTKAEALTFLGREPIDLIILDLSLESPEDGLEVLAGAAPRGLPCLIFTARNEADLWGDGWTRLQAKGATDLLLKGMNVEEQLLSKVAALIGSNN